MTCSSCNSSTTTLCTNCSSCSSCCTCGTCNTVACPSGTSVCIDVAEFCTTTTTVELESCNVHTCNITNDIALTLTEFKKMFYADGHEFSLAEPPQCSDTLDSVVESAWGKYVSPAYKALADFSSNYTNTIDISANDPIDYTYTRSDKFKDWIYVTDVSDNVSGWIPKSFVTTATPQPRVVNFNKLGGKDGDPSGVDLGYRFVDNSLPLSSKPPAFYAQKTILANMKTDMGCSSSCWSLCSRAAVFDELFNLAFVPTDFTDSCLHLRCGRSWKDLINAIDDQTYIYDLSGGENSVIFYWLPGDPSANRIPENLFSSLGSNIIAIGNADVSANYNGVTWTYTPSIWEVQTNVSYIIKLLIAQTFTLSGPVEMGDTISLNVRLKIFNENCSIYPNIVNIDYSVSVDRPLSDYCTC